MAAFAFAVDIKVQQSNANSAFAFAVGFAFVFALSIKKGPFQNSVQDPIIRHETQVLNSNFKITSKHIQMSILMHIMYYWYN
jgi:hypothetical protein